MLCGLRGKFALIEPYRSGLLLTHPRPLAEDFPTDFVWGCRDPQGGHGGQNLLGLALMQVRGELVEDVRTRVSALVSRADPSRRRQHPASPIPINKGASHVADAQARVDGGPALRLRLRGNPEFEHGLEVRELGVHGEPFARELGRVKAAGGIVFDSLAEAVEFEHRAPTRTATRG